MERRAAALEESMTSVTRIGTTVVIAAALAGCFGPEDRRPGTQLRGEVVATPPSDWSFTEEHKEISIEVQTPYVMPHSVTIWCVEVDGELYIAARDPDTKHWAGWADEKPDVRLGIGPKVYEVHLDRLDEPEQIDRVRQAYGSKYDLPKMSPGEGPPVRYWHVAPRA
jgi:hypothetical protein